ncbi:MAG: hypothetical protein ACP5NZ_03855 [Nanobdellota archaeon]
MMKIFGNKGEITTQQIVLIIILIVSFAVILFLLLRINFGGKTDSELCHNSVVMRSNPVSKEAIPLKCSRTYTCLTKDGSCEGMTKPEIEKVKSKEEIYRALAEQMADCWWMFGAGSIDYVGKDFFTKDNYCSICSQVGFDNSIKEIEGLGESISKDELYKYLAETKMPDSEETYAEYFFGTKDIERLKSTALKTEDGTSVSAATFGTININKQQFVMMGITSEVSGRVWKIAAGSTIFVVGLFAGYSWAGLIAGAAVVGVGEVGQGIEPEITAVIVQGNGVKNNFMAPTIQEANSNSLKKLDCYDVITSL